jgi:hypothetical protein
MWPVVCKKHGTVDRHMALLEGLKAYLQGDKHP